MHNRKSTAILWLAASMLLLAACSVLRGAGEATPQNVDLANTRWNLVSYGPPDSPTEVLPNSQITLEFDAEGRAGGTGGCNSYGGTYQLQGGSITFSEIVSTLMACADMAVTEQETRYLAALQSANTVEVSGDQLTITYGDGQEVLTFTRAAGS